MWFTETAWPPALILLIGAVAFAIVWTQRRKALFAALAGLFLLLIPVVFLIEAQVITPAEEIEAAIFAMREAVVNNDVSKTLEFFSSTAVIQKAQVATAMSIGTVEPDLHITDISTRVTASDTLAVSQFRANGTFVVSGPFLTGSNRMPTRWEMSWRKEAGEWKVTEVVRLNPINGEPMPILSRE